MIGRRDLLVLLAASVTAASPPGARAQQGGRNRKLGILVGSPESDVEMRPRVAAFGRALSDLGWSEGRNLSVDYRWGATDAGKARELAEDLVARSPEVIVVHSPTAARAVQNATRNIPSVFLQVTDPIGAGIVTSMARPSGNMTGFVTFEFAIVSKWLNLLLEIAPLTKRVAVLQYPQTPTWPGQLDALKSAAPSFGVEIIAAGVPNSAADIEAAIADFARERNGGMIILPDSVTLVHRESIVAATNRHHLPAIFPFRYFAALGGLMSYGTDLVDLWRRAATYVDRILRGEAPATLPVQAPTKYQLVINLRTARALGLIVPNTLLVTADEVVE
jgi:putative ABC transport system substrate-binding protein